MASLLGTLLAPLRRTAAPTKTLGTGGSVVTGGYLQSNERNKNLTGQQRYRTFSDMLANTSIVAAGTRYFLNLVAKAGWRATPADSSAEARRLAELTEEVMSGMTTPWHRVVRRAAMHKFHGFSVQEWTAVRREDGALGMLDVEPRPQVTIERWDLDETGTVLGVTQRAPQTGHEIYLPRTKLVYLVDDALNDSPEGLGLFRHMTELADRLKRFELLEAFGYETDLRGIPLGRAPLAALQAKVEAGGLSKQQITDIVKPLRDFIETHIKNPQLGLLLDSVPYAGLDEAATPSSTRQWDIELLKGDSAISSQAVASAIERLERELARIMGVEFLLLGGDGKGSLALSRDKTQVFGLLVDSALTELRASFQSDFVGALWRINGWDVDLMPELATESVQFRDVEQITGALRDMAQAGAVLGPDDPAISEVRELLGLSPAPELSDEEPAPGGAGAGEGEEEERVPASPDEEEGEA